MDTLTANIELLKTKLSNLDIDNEQYIELQKIASNVRSDLYRLRAQMIEANAHQNVYAVVCNKLLDRIMDKERY